MKYEALNQPTDSRIFPVPVSVVNGYLEQFSGFDEDQVTLISNANVELASPGSPAHHLLSLGERPDLIDPSTQQARAYRAGACIGFAILRKRINQLEIQAPDFKVKPGKRYLAEPDPLAWEYFAGRFVDIRVILEASKITEPLVYGLYTADDSIESDLESPPHLLQLKNKWHETMSFMEVEGTKLGEPDNIGLGISHAFRLVSMLEDTALARVRP